MKENAPSAQQASLNSDDLTTTEIEDQEFIEEAADSLARLLYEQCIQKKRNRKK